MAGKRPGCSPSTSRRTSAPLVRRGLHAAGAVHRHLRVGDVLAGVDVEPAEEEVGEAKVAESHHVEEAIIEPRVGRDHHAAAEVAAVGDRATV